MNKLDTLHLSNPRYSALLEIIEENEDLKELFFNKKQCVLKSKNHNFEPYVLNLKTSIKEGYCYLKPKIVLDGLLDLSDYLANLTKIDRSELLFLDSKKLYKSLFRQMSLILGAKYSTEKFSPGSLTNPVNKNFTKFKAIFINHDRRENQAALEALKTKTPLIGFNNLTLNKDRYTRVCFLNNFSMKVLISYSWVLLSLLARNTDIVVPPFKTFEQKALC